MNKAERLHNEAEVEASNNWQELEKIQSNKANIVTEKRFNSQIDKDQELSEIAERVKNNYYKRDQDFTNDNVDNLNSSAISNTNINNKPKMDKIFHFVHFICISAIYRVFAKFLIKVLNSLPNFS